MITIDFKDKNVLLINLAVVLGIVILIVLFAGQRINSEIDATMKSGVKVGSSPFSPAATGPSIVTSRASAPFPVAQPEEQPAPAAKAKAAPQEKEVIYDFPIEDVMLPQ